VLEFGEAELAETAEGFGGQAEGGGGQVPQEALMVAGGNDEGLFEVPGEGPGGAGGVGDGGADVVAAGADALGDVFVVDVFAAPEVGATGDVDEEAVGGSVATSGL